MKSEGNMLINQFMGVYNKILSTRNIHSWSDAPFYYTTEDNLDKVKSNIDKYSKYNKSWDWLIPVIIKIRGLNHTQGRGYHNAICASLIEGDIDMTYIAVVNYLKNYNNGPREIITQTEAVETH